MDDRGAKMVAKVAVLMGGTSAEREVSLVSGQSVLTSLLESGINATAIDPKVYLLTDLKKDGFTKVFNVLHGRGGEDGTLQGLLDYLGLPYTGSGVLSSALTMDKLKTKLIWRALGLPVVEHIVLYKNNLLSKIDIIDRMGLPLIVKPVREGSSLGMSKVLTEQELGRALALALNYDDTVLVEKCLTGAEITVGIVGDDVLPTIRIETSDDFYDFDAKYCSDATRFFCPGCHSEEQEQQLKMLALTAYQAVDCHGWGRVDMMLDEQNNPYLLEINTAPGMTSHSLVPMAAQCYGWTFNQLVCRILALVDEKIVRRADE